MRPGGSTPDVPLRTPSLYRTQTDTRRRVRNLERRVASFPAGDGTINCEFDGRGTYLQPGTQLDFVCDFDATITEWRILADTSGDLEIDVWKATFASFPPSSGDSITASDKPTLSSAASASDTSLTGWTTSINAGDVIRLNIDSCSGISRACLVLSITRTG